MAHKRDYKAEYRRRIERGLTRGLSRSQARGHPRAAEPHATKRGAPPIVDAGLEPGVKHLRKHGSLTRAAAHVGASRERLRRYIGANRIAKYAGGRWIDTDQRPRRTPIVTKGRTTQIVVPSYAEAARVGHYANAVRDLLQTNDPEFLTPYRGQGVRSTDGRFHPFETDPNALYRLASAGLPAFHEVYEITQN